MSKKGRVAEQIFAKLRQIQAMQSQGQSTATACSESGLSQLMRGTMHRKIHTTRYQKQVPVHQFHVDVHFLIFRGKDGKPIKCYQYTSIDDATHVRALKIYNRHT